MELYDRAARIEDFASSQAKSSELKKHLRKLREEL